MPAPGQHRIKTRTWSNVSVWNASGILGQRRESELLVFKVLVPVRLNNFYLLLSLPFPLLKGKSRDTIKHAWKIKHLEKVTITKISSLEDNSLVECSCNFLSYNAYTCQKNHIKEPATLALVQRTTHKWFTYNSASTFEAKLELFALIR